MNQPIKCAMLMDKYYYSKIGKDVIIIRLLDVKKPKKDRGYFNNIENTKCKYETYTLNLNGISKEIMNNFSYLDLEKLYKNKRLDFTLMTDEQARNMLGYMYDDNIVNIEPTDYI